MLTLGKLLSQGARTRQVQQLGPRCRGWNEHDRCALAHVGTRRVSFSWEPELGGVGGEGIPFHQTHLSICQLVQLAC